MVVKTVSLRAAMWVAYSVSQKVDLLEKLWVAWLGIDKLEHR